MKSFFPPTPLNSLVRGFLTLAIGIVLLVVPGLTLKTVIVTVGGMILFSGVINMLLANLRTKKAGASKISYQGFFNILWGLLFLLSPMTIVQVFGFFFGIIFLMLGLMQFFGALSTLSKSFWSWIFLTFGALMAAGGIFLLVRPIESAENILKFFGAILILYGTLQLTMAWRLRKTPQGNINESIVDTTYEEVK